MAITNRVNGLGIKVEPREAGTLTESGLVKTKEGALLARHATESGAREGSDLENKLKAAGSQEQELDAMLEQQKSVAKPKRGKKKASAAVTEPTDTVEVTITVEGFGGIPSQYDQVCIGNDMALIGLTARSFIPQAATIVDGQPSQVLRLSIAPDKRYVYFGSQVRDKRGVTNLILVELKGA